MTKDKITLTFNLLGDKDQQLAQYRWFKMLEKSTLAAYMEALFQCNAPPEWLENAREELAHE